MTQQISIEDAFPVYRERCTELFDENLLLRAQVAGLQRRLGELEQQLPTQSPPSGGPDLAAQPPFPTAEEPQELVYDGPR
ncbi:MULTISPECIES: hypothetical protein [unclassified Streptomyces]|uniref:hypothetical protein n=1 Tax=unclassified Streptomyces TaxID=2593676 RepID=UPI0022571B91|nr:MULTISPECIES: hypothetical protein [unclassified Streptomyces]MCX5335475.1 hypothetical protein [Streptomyces sp. NBC_00140]MCX5338345.1 hypothetical protein [Streptomyces sp. NBC_00140]MCX5365955.1 hypothetical protein [Streptomyces sp. NBC_00124]